MSGRNAVSSCLARTVQPLQCQARPAELGNRHCILDTRKLRIDLCFGNICRIATRHRQLERVWRHFQAGIGALSGNCDAQAELATGVVSNIAGASSCAAMCCSRGWSQHAMQTDPDPCSCDYCDCYQFTIDINAGYAPIASRPSSSQSPSIGMPSRYLAVRLLPRWRASLTASANSDAS